MLFNSGYFAFFFPIAIAAFFSAPNLLLRNTVLFVLSCIFYMFFIPKYLLILFLVIVVDFFSGILIERSINHVTKKYFLIISLTANISILVLFKYFNFIDENAVHLLKWFGIETSRHTLALILPIGLSFHTFQSMSYTFEVYFGRVKAERDPLVYANYVLFWPQLVAGPIERPQNLLPQLKSYGVFKYDNAVQGLRLMLVGFIKKLLFADSFGAYADPVFNAPYGFNSSFPFLIAAIAFSLQIYCDFSGYTDIARGAARIMGIHLMDNFKQPYFATSLSEFWRRWHISLSSWFRDYVYIPLGGNKGNVGKWMFNILFVFALSGLWHGANWTFVAWGLVHGVFLLSERLMPFYPKRGIIGLIMTNLVVVITWVFFRANTIGDAFFIFKRIFNFKLSPVVFKPDQLVFFGGLVAGLILFDSMVTSEKLKKVWSKNITLRWAAYYAVLLVIYFYGRFDAKEFIYFQF